MGRRGRGALPHRVPLPQRGQRADDAVREIEQRQHDNRADGDAEDAATIARDPVLAAKVLRLGGYECEFFVSQTPELTGMADCIIAGGTESMSLVPTVGWKTVPNRVPPLILTRAAPAFSG